MPKQTALKYALWILPGVLLDISLWVWFRPNGDNLLTTITLLIIVSIINLMAYHVFMVPDKVKSNLIDKLTGKFYVEEIEDLLDSIIDEVKEKQEAYNGYTKSALQDRKKVSQSKVRMYTNRWKASQVASFVWIAAVIFYSVPRGFNLTALYVEWATGLLLALIAQFILKRGYHSKQESNIIGLCIAKCGENEIFVFDGEF